MSLLNIKDLVIEYHTDDSVVHAVNGISLSIDKGETLGLVGETGAGKTTTALGIMRLVPDPPGKIMSGTIEFDGKNLLELRNTEMQTIRGNLISMIFQDPMTALNPTIRVGDQIAEVIQLHEKCSKKEAKEKAVKMLEMVGIMAVRASDFPHQYEAAGGHRHGAGLLSGAADCGRAHHCSGCDHSGAGASDDRQSEKGNGHLHAAHYPRFGRRS